MSLVDRVLQEYKKKYDGVQFTFDYITFKTEVLERCFADLKSSTNVSYLEVGVFEGLSTIWVLQSLFPQSELKAHIVDSFHDHQTSSLTQNLKSTGVYERCVIHHGPSSEKLRHLEAQHFDVILLDGSHQTNHVLEDLVLAWPLLRIGGRLIIDDYKLDSDDPEIEPWVAVDAFLTCYKEELEVIYKDYFVIVQKKERYSLGQSPDPAQ